MNVLLASFGTRGDLQPMLALAQALAARGHGATVAGPPDFAAWAARLGVTYASVGDSIERLTLAPAATKGRRPSREDLSVLRRWYSEHYAPLAPLVEAADVVVSTGLTSAPMDLAEKHGKRLHQLIFCPSLIPSSEHPAVFFESQRLPGWVNRLSHWLQYLIADLLMSGLTDAERKKLGLGKSPPTRERLPYHNLVVASEPALAPLPRDVRPDRWVLQTGAFILDDPTPLEERVVAFLDRGPPPVYVGFGSMMDLDPSATRAWVSTAARQAGVRAILLGPELETDDDVVLTVKSVNHQALFPRCAAVVHHGGAGTTTAAARAGVPQVVAPHLLDQFFWAHRLNRLGVAGPPVTARRRRLQELTAAFRAAVQDEGRRERARALKAELRQDGVARMVAALERPLD